MQQDDKGMGALPNGTSKKGKQPGKLHLLDFAFFNTIQDAVIDLASIARAQPSRTGLPNQSSRC